MQVLKELYEELEALYGYEVETSEAYREWNKKLKGIVTDQRNQTGIENSLIFGTSNPDEPDANYQYARTFGSLIEISGKDGSNARLARRSIIALAYALWEDVYRKKICDECGEGEKNKIVSDVFGDLREYRHAILHREGRLDKDPKVIRLVKKGEIVSLTGEDMHVLFSILIEELNRIGKIYYRQNPGFSFDKFLNQQV